jgi:2-deoxy-D-gluconate 3-dehydrogenase
VQPDTPFLLEGRTAFVVGAGRPLGRAIANALAEAGADVAIAGLTDQPQEVVQVNSVANQIWSLNRRNIPIEIDARDPVSVEAAIQRIDDEWDHLDILVNAQDLVFAKPFDETSLEEWDATLSANLSSVALSCQAAGRLMMRDGFGRIINIVTVPAERGVSNMAAYAAAKGGVEALSRALSQEWARVGIAVNCIQIGFYEDQAGIGDDPVIAEQLAKMLPSKALVKSEDVTGLVVMLASDSGFITGQTIRLDGAATARV